MKYRDHRGGLDESMQTMVDMPRDLESLATHLGVKSSSIRVEAYGGFDKRIGWDTYIVLVDGVPFGFTDGPAAY